MSIGRWRSSMVLLGICVVALLIGALRLATQTREEPPGSSFSSGPTGAMALYAWLGDTGAQTQRMNTRAIAPDVDAVMLIQPAALLDTASKQALDDLAERGGTLVLAGDSLPWLLSARALGVTVQPAELTTRALTPDGQSLPIGSRFRVHADGAQPLLLTDDGQWLGLEMPYREGRLIVIGSAIPFTNAGLRDDATARFAYRDIVSPLASQTVAFDEYQRAPGVASPGPTTVDQLLFQTPTGLAIVYAGLLTFAFLLLAGRRFGPALAVRSAAESQRTMYEHVQMLADLYRRAGQLGVVRGAFSRHYGRLLSRGGVNPEHQADFAEALGRVDSARTESELTAAVADAHDAR
jgi:hypothetical protein